MIGVIADSSEHDTAREFFELFKTPWEFYRDGKRYDVVLCARDDEREPDARLVLIYSGSKIRVDGQRRVGSLSKSEFGSMLSNGIDQLPIYGKCATFPGRTEGLLKDECSQECAAYIELGMDMSFARIGYDLFDEVRTLLTVGQPPVNAGIATLELHISFLRTLIAGQGILLAEIPPVPEGFQLIACLTHDVDHPSILQQKFDHTLIGFVSRATVGSCIDVVLGRLSIGNAWRNWIATFRLPFVYLGLAKDFWRDFDDRYLEIEGDLPSTFFLIPRKDYAGKRPEGTAPSLRSVRYQASDLSDSISKLRAAGREIGLHGIDAWMDSDAGREELTSIRQLTGASETGVRMHWLYFDENSPRVLEEAGAEYDSTVGYNVTVGYRAGTTQVFKPLSVKRLLELPLHAMDTALFYLSYLALSPRKASARLCNLAGNVARHGGCFTINWHDRSLAAERLWGDFYRELLEDLKGRGAWFATASDAVAWFRKRRSASFEFDPTLPWGVKIKVDRICSRTLPGLRLRIHNPGGESDTVDRVSGGFVDVGDDNCAVSNLRQGLVN
jgi:peptidoglycan/xylan/chitin deacetylase (PgdA/CDA1 family)